MANSKVRKPSKSESAAATSAAPGAAGAGAGEAAPIHVGVAAPKRVPPGSIKLQLAGELVLVRNPRPDLSGLFRRYEALFETFANMPRPERLINYKFLNALMLTSHAKKLTTVEERRRLFDLKNALYFDLANDREVRRKVTFKYLESKQFRVVSYCPACQATNEATPTKRHQWKFCRDCTVDRNFYNVLSMQHKFASGSATLFLSNEHVTKIPDLQLRKPGRLEDVTEEAVFDRYHYNVKNLDAIDLASILAWHARLVAAKAT